MPPFSGILLAGRQLVQQYRQLAGDRDPRLLDADPLGQLPAPGAQRARSLQTGQQHGRRLVQIPPQQRVALVGDSPGAVEGLTLIKRLTLIVRDGIIEHVFYPVCPSDQNPRDVVAWLQSHRS
jgi:hypothetical protein